MEIAGKTTDGKLVVSGVGAFCFTHGIPLEIVLDDFRSRNLVVDWMEYLMTALKDGHNPKTIRSRIDSAVSDIHGHSYSLEIMTRVDRVLNWLTAT